MKHNISVKQASNQRQPGCEKPIQRNNCKAIAPCTIYSSAKPIRQYNLVQKKYSWLVEKTNSLLTGMERRKILSYESLENFEIVDDYLADIK